MSSSKAAKRIATEIKKFREAPPEFVPEIFIDESDIHNVYFIVKGPPKTDYEGGLYVLNLKLPPKYPMEPPEIRMMTPNGRFLVDKAICTTFSNYHRETWAPTYNFTTIVVSLVSFMTDDDPGVHIGQLDKPSEVRKQYAANSKEWNIKNGYGHMFDALK